MLVDGHTHLDSFPDREVSEILRRAKEVGVACVVVAGTTLESSRRAVGLTSLFPAIFAGVGVHPMDLTGPIDAQAYARLRDLAAASENVVMISEIGLDFMAGTPDRAVQYQAFREQIRLARDLELPVVFHTREAHDETLRVLREERAYEVGGAMHYFQADLKVASRAIDLGFHISLARPLLRLPHLQQVAAALPLDAIVLESDAAPQPFKARRENWTEPRHVGAVAEKLAELRGEAVEEIEVATTRNFVRMIGPGHRVIEEHLRGTSPPAG